MEEWCGQLEIFLEIENTGRIQTDKQVHKTVNNHLAEITVLRRTTSPKKGGIEREILENGEKVPGQTGKAAVSPISRNGERPRHRFMTWYSIKRVRDLKDVKTVGGVSLGI